MADEKESIIEQFWNSLTFQRVATLIGLLLLAALVISVWQQGYKELLDQINAWLSKAGEVNFARGVITSLVVLVTVTIALILVIGLFYSKNETIEKRFALGKDVLTIFIGILGTIMGFYFAENRVSPENVQKIADTVKTEQTENVGIEKKAIDMLLKKDFDGAVKSFDLAFNATPALANIGNIDAIRKLLATKKDAYKTADEAGIRKIWQDIFREISTGKLTVGMTEDMKKTVDGYWKAPVVAPVNSNSQQP